MEADEEAEKIGLKLISCGNAASTQKRRPQRRATYNYAAKLSRLFDAKHRQIFCYDIAQT
jgi:hypothetical protein